MPDGTAPSVSIAVIGRRRHPAPNELNMAIAARMNPSFGEAMEAFVAIIMRTERQINAIRARQKEI